MEFDRSLAWSILFVIFVTMMIASVICSIFILYHFVRSKELCQRINNHIILILLIVSLIQVSSDLPFALVILHTGFVLVQTPVFCLFWSVYNYSLVVISLMLMAYGCIERYFLVFHAAFFKRHLILLHYGPLLICVIYPVLLYIGLIVIYPCETYFDYTLFVCGGACYQYEFSLGLFDWFCNVCNPVVVGAIASTVLIIHVLNQKRRVGQREIWKRNRKMVLQLVVVSIFYIIVWFPSVVGYVVPIVNPDAFALILANNLFIYFGYIAALLCPFVCLVGLPNVRDTLKNRFKRRNAVQPTIQTIR